MPICLKNDNLCFFTVPKTASTTIKSFFFGIPSNPSYKLKRIYTLIHLNSKTEPFSHYNLRFLKRIQNYTKLAVIRDPIERVVSFYKNKIVEERCLYSENTRLINKDFLPLEPSFDCFVEHFETYRSISPTVNHHTGSTVYFLGKNPKFYTRLYKMTELEVLRQDLEQILQRPIQKTHLQQSSTSSVLISNKSLNKLKKIFEEDYFLYNF